MTKLRPGQLVTGLVFCIPLLAPVSCSLFRISREEVQRHPAEPGMGLLVDNACGDVTIGTWDHKEIEVMVVRTSWGGADEFDRIVLNIESGEPFRIETSFLEADVRASVDLHLRVPMGMSVERVTSYNGDIVLAGTVGDAQLESTNGDVTITGHRGLISASTTNGNITMIGDNEGFLVLDTTHGLVTTELVESPTVDGRIKVSNGGALIYLGENVNADLRLRVSNGELRTEGTDIDVRHLMGTRFEVVLGDSGAIVDIVATNGDIQLASR
ncbi:hypothetical protein JW921_09335 [Candidatus Fermentibacterales bacterium]|nr:hypothetical protein [Candidatus Fermentibacterales bacterium]